MITGNIEKRRSYLKNVFYKKNPDEVKIVDKMFGCLNSVIYKHRTVLTDFLDPGERNILETLAGSDIFVQGFGGYANAIKKRMILTENSVNLISADYQLAAFQIYYPSKFSQLTHSSILGSLANSGVRTNAFGDIITDGKGKWQFFVKAELENFFQEEINRIGRVKVNVRPIPSTEILVPQDDSQLITIITASLRIDAVLAVLTHQSRQQVKLALTNNLVKLNWHSITDFNIIIKVNDILSLRHFGRSQIDDIKISKKGKYKVVLKLWQTRKRK